MTILAEWQLVLAVISAIIGVVLAVRIGAKDLIEHIDFQFREAEDRHQKESAAFREFLDVKFVTRTTFDCEISRLRESDVRIEAKIDRALFKHHNIEPE